MSLDGEREHCPDMASRDAPSDTPAQGKHGRDPPGPYHNAYHNWYHNQPEIYGSL